MRRVERPHAAGDTHFGGKKRPPIHAHTYTHIHHFVFRRFAKRASSFVALAASRRVKMRSHEAPHVRLERRRPVRGWLEMQVAFRYLEIYLYLNHYFRGDLSYFSTMMPQYGGKTSAPPSHCVHDLLLEVDVYHKHRAALPNAAWPNGTHSIIYMLLLICLRSVRARPRLCPCSECTIPCVRAYTNILFLAKFTRGAV